MPMDNVYIGPYLKKIDKQKRLEGTCVIGMFNWNSVGKAVLLASRKYISGKVIQKLIMHWIQPWQTDGFVRLGVIGLDSI